MGVDRSVSDLAEGIADAARRAGQHARSGDWRTALPALAEAERLTDEAMHVAARQARAHGWSWNRIGPALGVTQQAAWRRFTNPRRADPGRSADGDTPTVQTHPETRSRS